MKAVGIDIGTAFIGSARYHKDNIAAKYVRDGFFVMPYSDQRKHMLQESKVSFMIKDRINAPGKQDIYVIGNEAFDMAVLFSQELRRPLAAGVISAKERDSEFILKEIIRRVAGDAEQGDIAYFSVPADPVDRDFNTIYHREMFRRFLTDMGYSRVEPVNEAMAVAWSELEDKDLTGLAMSCLTPGQKVFTDRGFTNIEDIKTGYTILTKDGKWAACTPTSRQYTGIVYEIAAYGAGKVETTSDHKVWVCRNDYWHWVSAKDVLVGDLVKQPWVNYNFEKKRINIFCEKRITSSKKRQSVCLPVSAEVMELIGYFLGDGHIQESRNHIAFTFSKDEAVIADRVLALIQSIFDCEGRYINHSVNDIRVGFDCAWFCNWLSRHCYDDKGVKIVPWQLENFSDHDLRHILKGLIESDGSYTIDKLVFCNTSPSLVQFVYLGLLRLGLCPSFYSREPRLGGVIDGRQIVGSKDDFLISCCGYETSSLITWFKNPIRTAKKSITHGAMVAKVTAISERNYSGLVYDVSVEGDDHSFCVPGIAIHNCGAGMINIGLCYRGLEVFSFSVARAGDWVDQQVAKSRGIAESDAASEKESDGLDLLAPKDDVQEAITIFYKAMLEYSIGHIAAAMERHRRDIKIKEPLNFVVAGGTTMPKGFLRLLAEALKEHPLPIPVGKVWQAKNPVLAVCRGCLKAASKLLQDPAFDGVKDVSNGNNEKHAYPKAPKEEAKPVEAGEKKEISPKDARDNEQKARVVQRVGGFAEAIDLTMES